MGLGTMAPVPASIQGPVSSVDLSADLGEIPGSEGRRLDAALMESISTAHVACGGHAGDPESMRSAIDSALRNNVALGAHPSYLDREGFGRRRQSRRPEEVVEAVGEQLAVLDDLAVALGARVVSVKPHGALYHDLSADTELAAAFFEFLVTRQGSVVLDAGSRAAIRAERFGLSVVAEGFCDRRYEESGALAPRGDANALLVDPALAELQALELVRHGITVRDARVDSLCVHSDQPAARAIASGVRAALEAAGIRVCAP